MKVINFMNDEIVINLTLNDLYDICSALATEAFNEGKENRLNNAKRAWIIREKICKKIDKVKKEYKIEP